MTGTREKAFKTNEDIDKDGEESKNEYPENLVWVLCMRYSITFWKKFMPVSAFFDFHSEVNAIHPTFAQELGLPIRPINVEV